MSVGPALLLGWLALSCDASQGATRVPDPTTAESAAREGTDGVRPDRAAGRPAPALDAVACSAPERLGSLPAELPEASGAAPAARRGELWTHNDSKQAPMLFRIDVRGRIAQRVRLTERIVDWEDLAVARCGSASCLYVADIGDNLHARAHVRIIRLREPAPRDTSAGAGDSFPFRYPDGPADAEAIFVLPGERVHVITKGRNRPATLYRYPGRLRSDTVTLERVRALSAGLAQIPEMVTGASATRDGHHVAIRSYGFVDLFNVRNGELVAAGRVDLASLGERQGEGVALRDDGEVLLVSERGPGGRAGAIARVRCALP